MTHIVSTLLGCAAQLGLAFVALVPAAHSPLAFPLALLCLDLFSWNLAALGYQMTGDPVFHYLDLATSPFSAPLTLHMTAVFVGRRRDLRRVLMATYCALGALASTAIAAFVSPSARAFAGSPRWAVLHLGAVVLIIGYVFVLLRRHLVAVTDPDEQMRTRLVAAAVAVGTILASTELMSDIFPVVPRCGSLGVFGAAGLLGVAVFRFRLLEKELSSRGGLFALGFGVLAVMGHLAIFHVFASSTALLAFGTVTNTAGLFALYRQLAGVMSAQRERIESLAVLGRFSAQMAHDLKNPLAALKGAVQYLREEQVRGRSLHDAGEFLELLCEQVDRVGGVVEKYQRLGRFELAPRPMDANQVVRSVAALQPFATKQPVELRLELASELPALDADADLIALALENLIRNGVEAMPEGGRLTLRTRLLDGRYSHPFVSIAVQDTGIGMDARVREMAFDDFYTTKAQGSGLGLAFVRRVAVAHGGTAKLQSQLGKGTIATIELPVGHTFEGQP